MEKVKYLELSRPGGEAHSGGRENGAWLFPSRGECKTNGRGVKMEGTGLDGTVSRLQCGISLPWNLLSGADCALALLLPNQENIRTGPVQGFQHQTQYLHAHSFIHNLQHGRAQCSCHRFEPSSTLVSLCRTDVWRGANRGLGLGLLKVFKEHGYNIFGTIR